MFGTEDHVYSKKRRREIICTQHIKESSSPGDCFFYVFSSPDFAFFSNFAILKECTHETLSQDLEKLHYWPYLFRSCNSNNNNPHS